MTRVLRHPKGFTLPILTDRITQLVYDPNTQTSTELPFNLNSGDIDHVDLVLYDSLGVEALRAEMTVAVGANGDVSYAWEAGDVDTLGLFTAVEEVWFDGGGKQAAPSFQIEFFDPADVSFGTCGDPWVTGDELAACLGLGDEGDPIKLDAAVETASSVLFDLSGRLYPGVCQRTVRPCYDPCGCGWGQVLSRGHLVGWNGGRWTNDCGDRCGCGVQRRVRLAGIPIRSITQVKIDGVALSPDEYRLDAGGWLSRVNGGWPICQATGLADTEPGTFSVTYTWGAEPPSTGRDAALALASQLYQACSGGDCDLPGNIQNLSRQGISFAQGELMNLGAGGSLGIPTADLFLSTVNPRGIRRRPAVFSPDIQPHARRY